MVSSQAVSPGPGAESSRRRQRVLVLGASGFIGKRVVSALARTDWATPVAAVFRTRPRADAVESIQVDARDANDLQRALETVEGVVNCVAGDDDTIVAGARNLFSVCAARRRPLRVVHLSTMMVYGTAVGTVDEASPLLGDWDGYSAAKTEAERLSRNCAGVVLLRPGIVYGPDSPIWTGNIGEWLREGRLGDLGDAGLGCCNLVHVDDVVQAVMRALQLPGIEGEAFNLSLAAPPSWNEYFRLYAAALPAAYVRIPPSRIKAELYLLAPPLKLAEIAARALHLKRRLPVPIRPWLLRLCGHSQRLNVTKAEHVLGMEWMSLDEGLRQSAAWALGASRLANYEISTR